jgi:hypothetical protein
MDMPKVVKVAICMAGCPLQTLKKSRAAQVKPDNSLKPGFPKIDDFA